MKKELKFRYDEERILKRTNKTDSDEILHNINHIKKELDCAYANYEFATEPELIDSYIYDIMAIQLKYQYLIQQAKELGIIANMFPYNGVKKK